MLKENTFLIRNNEIIANKVENEVVMMDIESGKYYSLENVSARIWELTENKIKVDDLYKKLMEEYNIEEEKCIKDVNKFLDIMINKKIITASDEA